MGTGHAAEAHRRRLRLRRASHEHQSTHHAPARVREGRGQTKRDARPDVGRIVPAGCLLRTNPRHHAQERAAAGRVAGRAD